MIVLFVLFIVLCPSPLVIGSFIAKFQFHSYKNPDNRDSNGQCCDNVKFCFNPCDTRFTELCIREGNVLHDQTGQCITTSTKLIPGHVGHSNIQFGNSIGDISNPFSISWNTASRSGYQLYLVVEDNDPWPLNDDLIDRIIVDIPTIPVSVTSQTVTGIYNIATLVLSYSLSCNQHYYGSDCSVNCIPHNDDTNGHYTCNSITGAIICRHGWQNTSSNCMEVDCHLTCNSTGGQCINGSCICNTGWSGGECDKPHCAIGCNPQGGYCTAPNECLCYRNWNGTNCSESLCAVNCSSIGGVCPTANNCTCLQGYTGHSCEIDLYPCDHQMPCLNEANCSNTNDIRGYNCSCSIGYTGENCETDIDECSMKPCLNSGTCLNDVPGSFICICDIGWTGEICEYVIDYCDSNPCMNNGSCHNLTNGHYCHCPIQYEGLNCELTVDVCVPNPCQNNATCTNHYTNYTCTCTEGYTGNNCETLVSTSTVTSTSAVQIAFAICGSIVGLGIIAVITVAVILIIVVLINLKKHKQNDNNLLPANTSNAVCNPNYSGCNIDNGHHKFPCDYEMEIPVLHNTSCELPHVYETIGSPQPVYSRLNREEHRPVSCESNVYNQLELISSGDYERCSNIEYDGQSLTVKMDC